MGAWHNRLASGAAVAGCFVSGLALADTLVFDLSTSLRHNDNLGLDDPSFGSSLIWDTTVGATYTAETATSILSLTGQGVVRFADLPSGQDSGFEDPQLGLSFEADVAEDARVSFNASHRRTDLSFLDPLGSVEGDLNSTDLVQSSGTRITNRIGAGFEMESGQGWSLNTRLNFNQVDYQDTDDSDLSDSETLSGSVTVGLDLTETTQANLSFNARQFETDDTDQTERDSFQIGVGLIQELSATTVLDVGVGYSETETRDLDGTTTEDGLTGRLSLVRDLVNGTASVGLNLSQDAGGSTTTLRFGRAFETQTGSFDGSIGLSWNDNGDETVIGRLSYSEAFRTGQFTADLSRSVVFDDDDDEDITSTRASVTYQYDINELSRLNLSASFGVVEDSTDQTERQTLRAAYSRDLTEDWMLTGGYEYRVLDDDDGRADSNTVFLTLSRQFEFLR